MSRVPVDVLPFLSTAYGASTGTEYLIRTGILLGLKFPQLYRHVHHLLIRQFINALHSRRKRTNFCKSLQAPLCLSLIQPFTILTIIILHLTDQPWMNAGVKFWRRLTTLPVVRVRRFFVCRKIFKNTSSKAAVSFVLGKAVWNASVASTGIWWCNLKGFATTRISWKYVSCCPLNKWISGSLHYEMRGTWCIHDFLKLPVGTRLELLPGRKSNLIPFPQFLMNLISHTRFIFLKWRCMHRNNCQQRENLVRLFPFHNSFHFPPTTLPSGKSWQVSKQACLPLMVAVM